MAQTVKINGVTYNDVKEVKLPLASDVSQVAVFPDTSDATAVAGSIKNNESAYVNGKKVTGTMPLKGSGGGTISTKEGTVSIPEGYYDGSGFVGLSETEKAKLISANIRNGITLLGVDGSMSSTEGLNPQSKAVTPTKAEQVVLPDEGYNCLSQVTVAAIPDSYITTADADAEADDIKNGKSAYVNGVKVIGTHTDPTFTLADGVLSIA